MNEQCEFAQIPSIVGNYLPGETHPAELQASLDVSVRNLTVPLTQKVVWQKNERENAIIIV